MRSSTRRAASLLLIVQVMAVPAAHAQVASIDSSTASENLSYERANALFREGRRLMAEGRHQEACENFEQSLTLEDAVGTKFNLAACWENLGRTASAQALFGKVADETQRLGQKDRAKVARERAAALETRLSRLVVDVQSPVDGLTILRNADSVDSAAWGSAIPVDPGTYEIRANAPGKTPWTRQVFVSARRALVWISVPRLADEPGAGKHTVRGDSVESPAPRTAAPQPDPERLRTWRPVAFGLGALGLGGLAAGTVFALKYRSSNDAAEGICTSTQSCPSDQIDRHDDLTGEARAARTGAFIGFGLGAAALAGAAIAYFVVPLYRSEGAQVSARPAHGVDGSWAVSAEGQF